MRIFEEFWWASAMSRMDTRDAQFYVQMRSVSNVMSSGVPPEEVTTFNLVRRLAGRRSASGGFAIALHSRPLEGGHAPSGRAPSGADLELAVEVAPGAWVDLALQAKKFNPGSHRYDGWDPHQNNMLVRWARTNGRRGAGMLLYNSSDPPFAPPGKITSVFNLCCCSYTQCYGRRWPSWRLPNGRSPLAISLILDVSDPRVSGLSDPTPQQIADLALPWDCIFCRDAQRRALRAAIGSRPRWVDLLDTEQRRGSLSDEPLDEETRQQRASYSLVLGMSDTEREEYEW
jgi:hypothetical protein